MDLLGLVEGGGYSIDGYDDDEGRYRQVPVASILIYLFFFPDNDVCLLPNKFALSIFIHVDHRRIYSLSLPKRTLVGSPRMLQSL